MIKLIQRLIERIQKKNSSSKAPESGFSEKPEGWEKDWHRIRDLVRNRFVLWGSVLLIAAYGSYVVMSHKTPKPKALSVPAAEQNRVAMTAASMERAIDASFRSKEPQASVKPLKILPRTKRKLDSAMGVFLFKKEPERVIQTGIERPGKTKLGLASGAKIPALLGERVFSFNVDAPVVALVSKDFMAGEKTVIPKGSKFLGEANVLKSLDRINVRFQLLVFPDGHEIRVNALALSEDGAAGIKGKVEKHTDKKIAKALGESVLSMGALFLGGRSQDPFSMQNQLELNLAQNLSDEARRNLRNVNVEKSVTVEALKPIFVFLLEAV